MRRLNKFRFYLAAALVTLTTLFAQHASTKRASTQGACLSPCQFRFVVYGDTRNWSDTTDEGDVVHRMILETVVRDYNPSIILQTGDLVFSGSVPDEWKNFDSLTKFDEGAKTITDKKIPYYPAPGNHDKCVSAEDHKTYIYKKYIPLGVKSKNNGFYYVSTDFDKYNVRFIALDTPQSTPACRYPFPRGQVDSQQLTWLEDELKDAKAKHMFVIPFFHHPVYSIGDHGGYDNLSRGELEKKFGDYGVRLVFQGHDHDYYRTQRGCVTYIVSGGGGAPLRPPKVENMDQRFDGDKFLQAYNFSVCDVYPDRVEVKTYVATEQEVNTYASKGATAPFNLWDTFTVTR